MRTLKFREYKVENKSNDEYNNFLYSDDPPHIIIDECEILDDGTCYPIINNMTMADFFTDIFTDIDVVSPTAPQSFKKEYFRIKNEIQESGHLNLDKYFGERSGLIGYRELFGFYIFLDRSKHLSQYTRNLIESGIDIEGINIEIRVLMVLNKKLQRIEFLGKLFYLCNDNEGDGEKFENPQDMIDLWGQTNLSFFEDNDDYNYDVDELKEFESELLDACTKTADDLVSDLKNILKGN